MDTRSATIDALIVSLGDSRKPVIRKAADALIACLEEFPDLPGKLERLLADAGNKNHWALAYVLAHHSHPPALSIEVLLKDLGNPDPDIRWAVLLLLAKLAKEHTGIGEKLLDLLQSGNPTQRRMAVYCLRDMREGATFVALSRALDDPEATVRVAAITSLRSQPELGKATFDQLLRRLAHDPDARVRCSAAAVLGQVGPNTDDVRDALKDAAESVYPQLRKAARAALTLLEKREPVPGGQS
ncbi:MAG: HEAT repeat domain-containing protein [Candidatus Binatia bacterium]